MVLRRTALALLHLCVLVAASPRPVKAGSAAEVVVPAFPERHKLSDAERARVDEVYEESASLYQRGDLEGALGRAEEVFGLLPNTSTALVRAELLGELGRHCEAMEMLLVANDLDPTKREWKDIDRLLKRSSQSCRGGFGWAQVVAVPATAVIRVSGVEVPSGRTVGLAKGEHHVQVEAEGYAPLGIVLVARPGEATGAELKLTELPRPPAPPIAPEPDPTATPAPPATPDTEPESPPEPPAAPDPASAAFLEEVEPSGPGALPWVLLAAGAASAAGGAGMTLWALDGRSEADRYDDPAGEDARGLSSDERRRRYLEAEQAITTRRVASFVLYGLGAASAVAGVVLLWTGSEEEPGGVRWAPSVSPVMSGISLHGSF